MFELKAVRNPRAWVLGALLAVCLPAGLANCGFAQSQITRAEPARLPLGMVAEAIYAETRHQLAPAGRLTFVSDGVVEATNSKSELYGFQRAQAISTESAAQIAKAAEGFGQEDDITVLTVARSVVAG